MIQTSCLYSFARAAVTKHPRLDVKQQKVIASQCGGCKFELDVLAGLVPCEGPARNLCEERACYSLPSWLAGGCLLSVSSHHLPSVCVSIRMSSPGKDTGPIGSGPTLMTLF